MIVALPGLFSYLFFLFADDMAKAAPTEEKMQKCVDQLSDSCYN